MATIGGSRLWISWRPAWISKFHDMDSFDELQAGKFHEIHFSEEGDFLVFPDCVPRHSLPSNKQVELHALDGAIAALRPRRRVIVSVDTTLCYRRTAELPRAVSPRLAAILALDLSRVTPFKPEHIYSGYRILGAGSNSAALCLEQIVLRKDILKPLTDKLQSKNVAIEAFTFRDGLGPMLPIAIDPDGSPYGSSRFSRWMKMAGGSFAVALLSIGLVAIAAKLSVDGARSALGSKTLLLQQEVTAIRARLDDLKASSDEIADLLAWKSRGNRVSRTIEELSRVLPDDAYLEGFTIGGDQISLDGQAVAPEGLIARLESSPLFNNVIFGAPVFRNPGETYSHYSIRMSVESELDHGTP